MEAFYSLFRHIPFTNLQIVGDLFGMPILLVYEMVAIVAVIYIISMYIYTKNTYGPYLYTLYGYILIGGKFADGKTRALAQFARDVFQKPNTFVISNFYNAYSFLSFSSFNDFCNILDDLLLLGEYQNFTNEEAKKIEERFPSYFSQDERQSLKKYRYIPHDGKTNCNFLLEADEFHQYLYSRNSISNFSGDTGTRLLQTMHQVRHYNTLCIMATQDLDDLDLKLRRLASYEIDTVTRFHGLFYGYNLFRYELNKRNTQKEDDMRQYRIMNKFPIVFFNSYMYNFFIDDFERIINSLYKKLIQKYNHMFGKNIIFNPKKYKRFKTLEFETKFNVKLEKDIYEKGDLFKKLNNYYKKIGQGANDMQ